MEQLYILQKAEENQSFINTKVFKLYSQARKTAMKYINSRNSKYDKKHFITGLNGYHYFKEISPDYWTNGEETIKIVIMNITDVLQSK